ncbi:MAG: hypothetical protein KGQ46_12430 [Hyphomicrobiales bacterium]|nr:hypothetical protein [Hyphomicrobiales bacterium]MDE2113833.1 hypothetical protein [Hyphomicrobiales bacterium]
MTAQVADRQVSQREGRAFRFPVAAATIIFEGSLVVRNGVVAQPGATAVGLVALGIAKSQADNRLGAAGAIPVRYEAGCFHFNIDPADPVTLADVGNPVFITDDNTICRTNGAGTKSQAGFLAAVDAHGVGTGAWVTVGVIV